MKKKIMPLVTGLLSTMIGLNVMVGWLLKSPAMVKVIPGSEMIEFNTAFFFIIIGLFFILDYLKLESKKITTVLGAIIGTGTLLILVEYIFNINLGIDWRSLHQSLSDTSLSTGRIPQNACISFLLISIYMLAKDYLNSEVRYAGARWMAYSVIAISALGYAGHALKLEVFYKAYHYVALELTTAIVLVLIGVTFRLRWGSIEKVTEDFQEENHITPAGIALMMMMAVIAITAYAPVGQLELLANQEVFAIAKHRFQIAVGIALSIVIIGSILLRVMLKPLFLKLTQSEEKSFQCAQSLYHVQEQLRTITDSLPAVISYITKDERYEFVNKTFEDWYKVPRSKIIGRSIQEMIGDENYKQLKPYINLVLSGETVTFEQESTVSYVPRFTLTTFTPGFRGTKVDGFYVMVSDISSRKLYEEHITHLAHHDTLTGLANRALFHQRLNQIMMRSQRNYSMIALLYMDVDKFKSINDTLGHNVGDELLKQFSQRLSRSVRSTDTVSRLGGDEFTVILEAVGNEKNAEIIINKILSEIRQPFNLAGNLHNVTSSIGVAYYTAEPITSDELIRRSDSALYKAKHAGRNCFQVALEGE
ncbi:MAG: GGDEF domain-containing protein [Pseudomonadota bacterium]